MGIRHWSIRSLFGVFVFVSRETKEKTQSLMGKLEQDKKLKKRISNSSSDEGKSKRSRTVEEKEATSKTQKKHKSDKPSKQHSDKELKSDMKHKDKRRKHYTHSKVEFQEISSEDYFSKNNEFATWLKEEKSTFFSDISSASARELFLKFVEKWNHGKLESRYYEGISTGPRTSHKWKIIK